jgi:hypothetical protein
LNRKVSERLASNDQLGMIEIATVSGYLNQIRHIPKVSTLSALCGKSKMCLCGKKKKKLFKLLEIGSNRIDMNLDIQKLIRNNYILTNLIRFTLKPE